MARNEDYGFPGDEETTDGPDVARARGALVESQTNTDEIDVVIADSRRLVAEIKGIGHRNHFVDKWTQIIRQHQGVTP